MFLSRNAESIQKIIFKRYCTLGLGSMLACPIPQVKCWAKSRGISQGATCFPVELKDLRLPGALTVSRARVCIWRAWGSLCWLVYSSDFCLPTLLIINTKTETVSWLRNPFDIPAVTHAVAFSPQSSRCHLLGFTCKARNTGEIESPWCQPSLLESRLLPSPK